MNRVAKFSKVSFEQFKADWFDAFKPVYPESNIVEIFTDKVMKDIYKNIKLPERATSGSAGYDFFAPSGITLLIGESIKIPTGIRCEIENGWLLEAYPRSGNGFKTGVHLANTVGIIDSDYFYADNEGHIMIKLVNDSSLAQNLYFKEGEAFCQGIFKQFGITIDDNAKAKRTGGFGSTNK